MMNRLRQLLRRLNPTTARCGSCGARKGKDDLLRLRFYGWFCDERCAMEHIDGTYW